MRIRVSYVTDASDDFRAAIRSYYGDDGLATREEVQRWCRTYGTSMDDDIMYEYTQKLAQKDGGDE